MIGLVLKDFMALKKYGRTLLIISVFYIIWGYTMDSITYVSGFITLLFSMMVTTSFYYDDAAKWDAYALSMPITRRDLVTGKYMLSLILVVSGFIVSLASSVLLVVIKKQPITPELFQIAAIMVGIAVLFQSIMIPVIIKLGSEKARIAMFAIFLTPTILVLGISKLDIPKPSDYFLHILETYLPSIAGLAILILFVISYFVSIQFMEKKDV